MLLDADRISMMYPKSSRLILDNINVHVDKGDFLVVTGASGSGKSTLLAILGGYLKPTEGAVKYEERSLAEMKDSEISELHRTKIGYVPQSNVMLKKYTVFENVIAPLMLGKAGKDISDLEENALVHLKQLGIGELIDRYPHELSGGELKRVSLARAMSVNPEIIIADEPTTGLDKDTGKIILEYLHSYSQTGKTVIVASHDERTLEYGNRFLRVENERVI